MRYASAYANIKAARLRECVTAKCLDPHCTADHEPVYACTEPVYRALLDLENLMDEIVNDNVPMLFCQAAPRYMQFIRIAFRDEEEVDVTRLSKRYEDIAPSQPVIFDFSELIPSPLSHTHDLSDAMGRLALDPQPINSSRKAVPAPDRVVDLSICAVCGVAASKACAKCKFVGYCSRDCQVAHWSTHKKTCKKGASKT